MRNTLWQKEIWHDLNDKLFYRNTLYCNNALLHYTWTSCQILKLLVVHAPGMLGMFSPPLWVSTLGMHHGTCITQVPWCMPGVLTSSFLWSQWWGKRSRHSRLMRNLQFCISGKRPMRVWWTWLTVGCERGHSSQHQDVTLSNKYHCWKLTVKELQQFFTTNWK